MLLTFRWRFDGKTLARFPRLSSALGHLKTGGYIMGILSSTFNKMGHWHIRQLVKDCTKIIIKLSMHEVDQKNNPYLTDSALDLLIEQGQYSTLKGRKFASLKEKFTKCVLIYVVRNLGRDSASGEMGTVSEEIEKYWPIFMTTKDGVQQRLKTE